MRVLLLLLLHGMFATNADVASLLAGRDSTIAAATAPATPPLPPAPTSASSISNTLPRRDSDGNILESGDGSLIKFGSRYYLYGTRYLPCPVSDQKCCYEWCGPVWLCGWRNMTVSVYSSADLVVWRLESQNAMPEAHTHPTISTRKYAFFEPAVIYNPATKKVIEIPLSNRESAREHGWGTPTPSVFSRGGTLLLPFYFMYADARSIDAVIWFSTSCGS